MPHNHHAPTGSGRFLFQQHQKSNVGGGLPPIAVNQPQSLD
ncbi:hypothetical protein C4J94_3278 [Pseudomonas sp. R5-89-07]|nr:hypothetical protein C4J94_3278 [Pseudomonas sp. R5-89-07]